MPYSSNDDLPPGVKDHLPVSAQTAYRKAFNSAYAGTCNGDDACSAKVAWSAVKNSFEKGEDGKWHRKSFVEFSLYITKAVKDKLTGKMRFVATASDTEEDSYSERMTGDLFQDFLRRIESEEIPPLQFCSEFWKGGLPYMSIAHYDDMNGEAVPGKVTKVYVDGKQLKAHGEFFDTPLGRACFESVYESVYNRERQDKVRISIGFLDYAHAHGNQRFERRTLTERCPMCAVGVGGKAYLAGHLIHLALTRVPVNRRTDIEPELEERAMAITRQDDAASIVGKELAEDLEEKAKLVGKSEADIDPVLVERAEDEEAVGETQSVQEPVQEADSAEVDVEKMASEGSLVAFRGMQSWEEVEQYEATMRDIEKIHNSWWILSNMVGDIMQDESTDMQEKRKRVAKALTGCKERLEMKSLITLARLADEPQKEPQAAVQPHPLDEAYEALKARYDDALKNGQDAYSVLEALQAPYTDLGTTLRSLVEKSVVTAQAETQPVPEAQPEAASQPDYGQMVEAFRSAIQSAIQPLSERIDLVTTQLSAQKGITAVQHATPPKRNLGAQPSIMQQLSQVQAEKPNSLKSFCERSAGLRR